MSCFALRGYCAEFGCKAGEEDAGKCEEGCTCCLPMGKLSPVAMVCNVMFLLRHHAFNKHIAKRKERENSYFTQLLRTIFTVIVCF